MFNYGVAPVAGSLFGLTGNGGGGGYGLGGGGTQGQNALPFWGLAQEGQEGSEVYLGGGGSATPENYLGDWVPEPRRKILSQIGFGNGAGSELLSLRKQYNAEKNNYAKQAIMSKIVNAETRFNRELQGKEYEYRSLARDANYAAARKMLNEEKAAGRGEGSGAMAANAILSNNHISHGIINHGRIVAPAGNAVEDALEAYQMTGRTPDLSLLQMLAVSDALSQDDYMPSGPFGLNKSLGGYKSMGIAGGSYTGNADAFAYGGDGSQYARQEAQNILRDYNWANDAAKSYQNSMNNKNPLGTFKGGDVMRGPGLPGIDANGWIPDWMGDGKYSPDQLSKALGSYDKSQGYYSKRGVTQVGDPTKASGKGSGQVAGSGYDPYDNGAMVPSYSGPDPNGWIDGYSTGSRNPQRFDPTVASDQYSPKLGNLTGWNQERMSKPYLQQDEKYPMQGSDYTGNPKPGRSFGQMLKGIGEAAIAPLKGVQNTWTPSYKGLFGTGPLFGDGDSRGLAAYSGPMLQPAMGIAQAPKIQRVSSPPRPGSSFGGSMSPSNDIFADQFAAAPSRGNSTTWPYGMRTQSSSFDRYPTGPMTAGQIQALMYGGF